MKSKPCRKSGGKLKFETHERALTTAGKMMVAHPSWDLTAYLCPFCDHYHLTSALKKRHKATRL